MINIKTIVIFSQVILKRLKRTHGWQCQLQIGVRYKAINQEYIHEELAVPVLLGNLYIGSTYRLHMHNEMAKKRVKKKENKGEFYWSILEPCDPVRYFIGIDINSCKNHPWKKYHLMELGILKWRIRFTGTIFVATLALLKQLPTKSPIALPARATSTEINTF